MTNKALFSAIIFGVIVTAVWLGFRSPAQQVQQNAFKSILSQNDSGFERALAPRPFEFPKDHGPHNSFRSEWWYFTGNLKNPYGRQFGYELTFFRFALAPTQLASKSTWRTNQLYMAHLTLTDVDAKQFYVQERFSRAGNNLAGASTDKFQVWLTDWSVSAEQNGLPLHLKAKTDQFALDLLLKAEHGPILQGDQGLSQKSAQPGNASYYYSYTRMLTEGNIIVGNDRFSVVGSSWMDREWSTSALAKDQQGWDWFALQLNDDTELMFYQLRRKDGQPDDNSAGTIVLADNSTLSLHKPDVHIKVLDSWTSQHSGVVYPSGWRLTVPGQQLTLEIQPLLKDQELNVNYRYWEGAVKVSGTKHGRAVSGQGYVELAGYQ